MANLTLLQNSIKEALLKLKGKQSPYQDSILVKEIRNNCNIQNKKNASIRYDDLIKAANELSSEGSLNISIHLDKVNNLLIKNSEQSVFLSQEDQHNRQRSEKSMTLLTDADISQGQKAGKPKKFKKAKHQYFDQYEELN